MGFLDGVKKIWKKVTNPVEKVTDKVKDWWRKKPQRWWKKKWNGTKKWWKKPWLDKVADIINWLNKKLGGSGGGYPEPGNDDDDPKEEEPKKEEELLSIAIQRDYETKKATMGTLTMGNKTLYTLEPPNRNNTVSKDYKKAGRILAGTYKVVKIRTDGTLGWRLQLEDKHGRTEVQIHRGNYPKDTTGCILPGTKRGNNYVDYSDTAMKVIKKKIDAAGKGAKIEVIIIDPPVKKAMKIPPKPKPLPVKETHRYIGNSNTKEIHDLHRITKVCNFDKIKDEHKVSFESIKEVENAINNLGYNGCWWCLSKYDTDRG